MFVWNKINTQFYSAKFLYWGDHVNSVPDLAASSPWVGIIETHRSWGWSSCLSVVLAVKTGFHMIAAITAIAEKKRSATVCDHVETTLQRSIIS